MNGIEKAVLEARDKLLDRSPERPHPADVLRALVDAVLWEAERACLAEACRHEDVARDAPSGSQARLLMKMANGAALTCADRVGALRT